MFLAAWAVPVGLIGEAMARGRGLRRGCGWAFAALAAEILVALFFASPAMEARALRPFDHLGSAPFLEEMRVRRDARGAGGGLDRAGRRDALRDGRGLPGGLHHHGRRSWSWPTPCSCAGTWRGAIRAGWRAASSRALRWPLGLAVAFVLAGLSVAAPPLRPAAYNVLLVLAFFFVLQGLAVVAFYANRLAGPPRPARRGAGAGPGQPVGAADPGAARPVRHLVRFPEVGRAAGARAAGLRRMRAGIEQQDAVPISQQQLPPPTWGGWGGGSMKGVNRGSDAEGRRRQAGPARGRGQGGGGLRPELPAPPRPGRARDRGQQGHDRARAQGARSARLQGEGGERGRWPSASAPCASSPRARWGSTTCSTAPSPPATSPSS